MSIGHEKRRQARFASWLAVGLMVTACSGGEPDGAVQFELEPIPAQPWIASGDLVEAGQVCEEGSRRNVGLAFPDGSPMTIEEFIALIDEAEASGLSPEDGDFSARTEWTCADGSGTFITLDKAGDGGRGQVVGGTGAFAGMTGELTTTFEYAPASSAAGPSGEGDPVAVHVSGTLQPAEAAG